MQPLTVLLLRLRLDMQNLIKIDNPRTINVMLNIRNRNKRLSNIRNRQPLLLLKPATIRPERLLQFFHGFHYFGIAFYAASPARKNHLVYRLFSSLLRNHSLQNSFHQNVWHTHVGYSIRSF